MNKALLITLAFVALLPDFSFELFHWEKPATRTAEAVDHSTYEKVSQCLNCHPRALPTHMKASPRHMSEDWPLDRDGSMLCLTCHDCISGSCMLRRSPQNLCPTCHGCDRGMACLIGTAHLGNKYDYRLLAIGCLGCHDGTYGPEKGPGDHPVGVLYIANKDFKSVGDRRVVMPEGRVTCVSCHNPYRNENARLVKSNRSSRLCLTCHKK